MPVAIITGASRGLGLATARALAGQGWSVVADARRAEQLQTAAGGIDAAAGLDAAAGVAAAGRPAGSSRCRAMSRIPAIAPSWWQRPAVSARSRC